VKRASPLPEWIPPQLATLTAAPPAGAGWLHEVKFDGYRILARLEGGKARLFSRRRNDWTASFAAVARAVEKLPVRQALLDGEVAVQTPSGRTSFQALQNAFTGQTPAGLAYFVFDLLHLDGEDLRPLPIEERKERLQALVAQAKAAGRIHYSTHHVGEGARLLEGVRKLDLEGLVSKRCGEPYCSGRGGAWLKTKCKKRQEFVVGGFTDPEGGGAGIGALILGYYRGRELIFAGKVGSGFSERVSGQLRATLQASARVRWPFVARPPLEWIGREAHWVRPELVVEVEFTEWTSDGGLRHPSFKGLLKDRDPAEVTAEDAAAAGGGVDDA
jgi:bifunctional non-homologous end joining protein LigD